jgi:hypothetical protein
MSQQIYRTTASDWEAARIGSAVVASKSKLVGSLCVYLICVYLWLNMLATKRGRDRKNGELGTIGTMNARILFSTTNRTNHTNVKARVYLFVRFVLFVVKSHPSLTQRVGMKATIRHILGRAGRISSVARLNGETVP